MKLLPCLLSVSLLAVPAAVAASIDPPPEHVKIMKEMGAANGKIRKGEEVAASAKQMAELSRQAMPYWAKQDDGMTALKNLLMASNMLATASDNKDATVAADASKMMGAACTSCHDAHREQVGDNQYKIK